NSATGKSANKSSWDYMLVFVDIKPRSQSRGVVFSLRVMPACHTRGYGLSRGRPGAAFVFGEGCWMVENRIDHAPGGFHAGIGGEQGVVTAQRVTQQAFVGRMFVCGRVTRDQLDGLATHLIARLLDLRAGRDYHLGTQPEAEVVRFRCLDLIKDIDGWPLQRDHYLSGSDRQALPGPDVEGHA